MSSSGADKINSGSWAPIFGLGVVINAFQADLNVGKPRQLYCRLLLSGTHPSSRFVADFVSIRLLPATDGVSEGFRSKPKSERKSKIECLPAVSIAWLRGGEISCLYPHGPASAVTGKSVIVAKESIENIRFDIFGLPRRSLSAGAASAMDRSSEANLR